VSAALAGVKSYQATVTTTSSSFGGANSQSGARGGTGSTATLTAVRSGSGFDQYIVSTTNSSYGKRTTETIIAGGKTCTRTTATGPYTCRPTSAPVQGGPGGTPGGNGGTRGGAGGFGARISGDPSTALKGATFTAVGARAIGGQQCSGYAYKLTSARGSSSGTLYIAQKTSLPCEQTETTSRQSPTGSGAFTMQSTTIWSKFNDPSLKIPSSSVSS
jgi:hypothetical protein